MRWFLGNYGAFLVVSAGTLVGCGDSGIGETDETDDALTEGEPNARVSGVSAIGLAVRVEPTRASGSVALLRNGTPLFVKCRTRGQTIEGTDAWNYLPRYRGYVSERYVTINGGPVPDCTAEGGGARPPPTPTPTTSTEMQAAIVREARNWVGTRETGNNCQPFSAALSRPCEAWCVDFIAYVWQASGANINQLTAWVGTLFTYGETNRTLKPRSATNVAPGDAVIWGQNYNAVAHAGLVTEVLPNGDLRVINGNWGERVQEQVFPRSYVVSGYGIGGFVSLVPR